MDQPESDPAGATARDAAAEAGATPMMAQYLEVKRRHPGALLFYRMGDFFELFFEDAEVAARALDLTLTRRGKHLGADIPMCGVPVHSHEAYLLRLIRAGHRVAICDQLEDPAEAKKRGAKSVVRRDVTRVVTPGTTISQPWRWSRARRRLPGSTCPSAASSSSAYRLWPTCQRRWRAWRRANC
jgi:DNA mismatch repair protein MutS